MLGLAERVVAPLAHRIEPIPRLDQLRYTQVAHVSVGVYEVPVRHLDPGDRRRHQPHQNHRECEYGEFDTPQARVRLSTLTHHRMWLVTTGLHGLQANYVTDVR